MTQKKKKKEFSKNHILDAGNENQSAMTTVALAADLMYGNTRPKAPDFVFERGAKEDVLSLGRCNTVHAL